MRTPKLIISYTFRIGRKKRKEKKAMIDFGCPLCPLGLHYLESALIYL